MTSVTPITWNVVGLDSNSPQSGPNRFPVGARVCSNGIETNLPVTFHWDPAGPSSTYINLSSGSPNPVYLNIPVAGRTDNCADAYFEVEVTKDKLAFDSGNAARGYYIAADGGLKTPRPRELYVKPLVSQARNGIIDLRFATTKAGLDLPGASVAAGGAFSLVKDQTYFIRMSSYTAPGGYEQLETFSTLPNTIFQILSVETTYTADTTTNVSSPNDKLYADACYWEEDPQSPNYLSCNGGGKIGGTMNVTYEVNVKSVGGGTNPINSLIYDLSGASYHYNSDYSSGGRMILLVDPALVAVSKRFSPSNISSDGTSTMIITISNPNPGEMRGVTMSDDLTSVIFTPETSGSGTMTLDPSSVVNGCGGVISATSTSLSLSSTDLSPTVIPAYGSCSIRVSVTADIEGTYENTAEIAIATATDSDTATLTVDNDFNAPPELLSSCPGTETTMATWTMPTTGQGSGGPPPPYTTIAGDVATATASYFGTGTSSISTTGNPANAWRVTSGWPAKDAALGSYFQFAVASGNTSGQLYGGVQILFDFSLDGNWANSATNTLDVYSSVDGSSYTIATPRTSGYTANSTWYPITVNAVATGSEMTYFRIYFTGQQQTTAYASLDNIRIRGCQNPDPPNISKAFSPTTIGTGANSTLTFTITNPNADKPLTGVAFNDEMPAELKVVSASYSPAGCTNNNEVGVTPTLTAVPGTNLISLSGAKIAGKNNNGTCTVSAVVTSNTAGVYENVSDNVDSDNGGRNPNPSNHATDPGIAVATLTVLAPPTIEKSFDKNAIYTKAYGGVSTLTFTIVNPNSNHAITGVGFSDDFKNPPVTDTNIVVAAAPNYLATFSPGCSHSTTPTLSAVAGSDLISLSNASIAAGGTCTVTVKVESAIAGFYENKTTAVTHILNAAPYGANTAYDTLLVTEPNPQITLLKEVGPSATGPWVSAPSRLIVEENSQVWYRFTVENTGDKTLSTVWATDPDLGDVSSCIWSDGDGVLVDGDTTDGKAPFTLPVSGAKDVPLSGLYYNDHYASCVVGPYSARSVGTQFSLDEYTNTATATGVYTDPDPDVTVSDTSSAIYLISKLNLVKSANKSNFIKAGDTLTYSYLVTNNGTAPLAAPLVIFDNKIASANISCPAVDLGVGVSTICTATYTITAADVANGTVTNIARARINGIYSPTDNVTVNKLPADLAADKRNNTANEVVAGQSFTWTLTVRNDVQAGYAVFPGGATILIDNLPNVGVASYALVSTLKTGITGNINCSISADKDLSCTAGIGGVTIPSHLTGTIAVTNGSPTVTGTDTLFNAELSVGSILLINDVPYTVATIDSDTQVTLTTNYLSATESSLKIPASFSVQVTVASLLDSALSYPVTLANPRASGQCKADPDEILQEINTDNNSCSNSVYSRIMPLITVIKTVTPHWDPINLFDSPKVIPGSFVNYKLLIRNSGVGKVDAGTTIITDKIPTNAELFVGDYDDTATASTSPVIFTDDCNEPAEVETDFSPSGLDFSYTDWANPGSLSFSNNATPTFGYTPTTDSVDATTGCDLAVTYFQVQLNGEFLGTLHSLDNKPTSFCLQYRVRLQ